MYACCSGSSELSLCNAVLLLHTGKGVDVYTRKQALLFLHVCLASVLNLRSPDDSQLPGSQLDKLVQMLFGDQEEPHIEPISNEGGVKTKTQLLAERQVLKQLLSTAVGAAADTDLAADATPFAHGVCRHFAMLFAAGCSSPSMGGWQAGMSQSPEASSAPDAAGSAGGAAPGGGGDSGLKAKDGRGRTPKGHALKELDAHLFFDALVEVPALLPLICIAHNVQTKPTTQVGLQQRRPQVASLPEPSRLLNATCVVICLLFTCAYSQHVTLHGGVSFAH